MGVKIKYSMRRSIFLLLAVSAAWGVISCSSGRDKAAVLWADRPEFAFYADYFNSAQNQYKVEVQYYDFPGQKLKENGAYPDIVVGSWLKNVSTRVYFKSLDKFFKNNVLSRDDFYQRLLALGNIDGKQYLLPVSFNAPVVIFARENGDDLSNLFTIDFDEMKKLGKAYNTETRGVYTKMGFSPTWDEHFLFITAMLFDVSFREASPIEWNPLALKRAMDFVYEWNREANTGVQAVDDFMFKYFYNPPAQLALSGRILFTFMNSGRFFTLPQDQQNNLDFRWIAQEDTIPLDEESVYFGLAKKSKAPQAAEAFLRWFFSMETQYRILEENLKDRMFETSFGISGGFSAMRPVTEQVFPQFYQSLIGHMPPADFLSPPNILPANWIDLKKQVILPYLHDRARHPDENNIYQLERRLTDWMRVND